MNLPEPQSRSFSSLMADIENGSIKIPQFQRDFVWSMEKSAQLLDSVVKGYPIGTFILWKTKEELRALRNLGQIDLPTPPEGDFIQYVLDGQQRLTSLFASVKGAKIKREDHEDDYADFFVDLEAEEDEPIVITERADTDHHRRIRLNDLLYGTIGLYLSYPEEFHGRMQEYKNRVNACQFSTVLIKDAPIEVATEIFTRLNVSGKPLSVFEIMVAKTFDARRDFDLAEKCGQLTSQLESADYGTLPDSVVLQTISILLRKECQKKDILQLPKDSVIDIWTLTADSIKHVVDYFRNAYRIPVSRLLPYPSLVVPFAYYFYMTKGRKPTGDARRYLQDFFWRAAMGGRYSQSVESRLAADIRRIDLILDGKLPAYDWAVDTSPGFIEKNGWFSIGRAYVKALLCLLAFQQPKSFDDHSDVRISNDWLKQVNSKNYHHFFPRAYLAKQEVPDSRINHIANITIVDDFLNKQAIKAQAPGTYMRAFLSRNDQMDSTMKSHLIDLDGMGVLENDYSRFFAQRCKALSRELKKRIIEQRVDEELTPVPSQDTDEGEE